MMRKATVTIKDDRMIISLSQIADMDRLQSAECYSWSELEIYDFDERIRKLWVA